MFFYSFPERSSFIVWSVAFKNERTSISRTKHRSMFSERPRGGGNKFLHPGEAQHLMGGFEEVTGVNPDRRKSSESDCKEVDGVVLFTPVFWHSLGLCCFHLFTSPTFRGGQLNWGRIMETRTRHFVPHQRLHRRMKYTHLTDLLLLLFIIINNVVIYVSHLSSHIFLYTVMPYHIPPQTVPVPSFVHHYLFQRFSYYEVSTPLVQLTYLCIYPQ